VYAERSTKMKILVAISILFLSGVFVSCENKETVAQPEDKFVAPPEGKYLVKVIDSKGSPIQNAKVYLSYSSAGKPPYFVTEASGFAVIPESRATKGGWVCIIASYQDANGKRYSGLFEKRQVSNWPLIIKVESQ